MPKYSFGILPKIPNPKSKIPNRCRNPKSLSKSQIDSMIGQFPLLSRDVTQISKKRQFCPPIKSEKWVTPSYTNSKKGNFVCRSLGYYENHVIRNIWDFGINLGFGISKSKIFSAYTNFGI